MVFRIFKFDFALFCLLNCSDSQKCFNLPSEMSRSRISHANIVGFSRLYCSIFETTAGVATLGLLPPIKPGGRSVPVEMENRKQNQSAKFFN